MLFLLSSSPCNFELDSVLRVCRLNFSELYGFTSEHFRIFGASEHASQIHRTPNPKISQMSVQWCVNGERCINSLMFLLKCTKVSIATIKLPIGIP